MFKKSTCFIFAFGLACSSAFAGFAECRQQCLEEYYDCQSSMWAPQICAHNLRVCESACPID